MPLPLFCETHDDTTSMSPLLHLSCTDVAQSQPGGVGSGQRSCVGHELAIGYTTKYTAPAGGLLLLGVGVGVGVVA